MKNIISIRDFSREGIDDIIDRTLRLKKGQFIPTPLRVPVASLFYEPSTRTRSSSEEAARRLGCSLMGFAGTESTSVGKGESLLHSAKMFIGNEGKLIYLRHHLAGAAKSLTYKLDVPIINCGDDSNGHPTQALIDGTTITEAHGSIDGLSIALVGDLKYGRTAHSDLQLFANYDVDKLFLVSPENLQMPQWRIDEYEKQTGKKVIVTENLDSVIPLVDVLYVKRIQRERFPEGIDGQQEYDKVAQRYQLSCAMVDRGKKGMIVMHALPINKENPSILAEVDDHPAAWYFKQAGIGVPLRQVISWLAYKDLLIGKEQDLYHGNGLWQDLPMGHGSKKGEHMIYRCDNGTVIDHIEPGKASVIRKVLGLNEFMREQGKPLLVVENLGSERYGKKDVIIMNDEKLDPEQAYKVGLVSKRAVTNYVENQKVIKKGHGLPPQELVDIIECQNTKCITRPEYNESVASKFIVEQRDPLYLRCGLCETPTGREGLRLIY